MLTNFELQSSISRLRASNVGSMPIIQFIDTVEELFHLRLQFKLATEPEMCPTVFFFSPVFYSTKLSIFRV